MTKTSVLRGSMVLPTFSCSGWLVRSGTLVLVFKIKNLDLDGSILDGQLLWVATEAPYISSLVQN